MTVNPFIIPQWPAPKHIKAYSTTRNGGMSVGRYASFNLGLHVGDKDAMVLYNRTHLQQLCHIPSEPKWLQQVHSDIAIDAAQITANTAADASYTSKFNTVCVIMTADCLPILITNQKGSEIAAIHAGWRGLAAGIVENTLKQLNSPPQDLMAWIGPGIGPQHYEVGSDVYQHFASSPRDVSPAFLPHEDKWLANMPKLAEQRLLAAGVQQIYHSNECTYSQPSKYFSYRREGITGRMATLIWIAKPDCE